MPYPWWKIRMDKIRTLLVDDELPARRRVLDLLEKQDDIEVTGIARDGREAVDRIRDSRPDLMFLDIQMPNLDGFGVLQAVGQRLMPLTIFVTAYDAYAIRAFEAHALDYLLKPFADERFEAALSRARDFIRGQRASEFAERVATLLAERATVPTAEMIDRLAIKSGGRVTFLDVREIDWIEAAGVYVNLHAGGRTYLYRASMVSLHNRLDPRLFIRLHRSVTVNANRIRELEVRTHGDHTVILKDGKKLPLSRTYRTQLEAWLRQAL
jgi:two-component system LytT family response regulator